MRLLQQSLSDYLNAAPALFWHMDNVRNEIIFLNEHNLTDLRDNIGLMLKNPQYARSVIHADDFELFKSALRCAKAQQNMSVVFRTRDETGRWHWLVMLGMPAPDASFCYVGLVACCSSIVEAIRGRGLGTLLADEIELMDCPVLLVDFASRSIAAANSEARTLFGYEQMVDFPSLDGLLNEAGETYRRRIYEHLIFNTAWHGPLTLHRADGSAIACLAHMRPLSRDGHNYLWLGLENVAPSTQQPATATVPSGVAYYLSCATTDRDALNVILHNQPEGMHAEAVMLSRIFASENRVVVSGVGAPFEGMPDSVEYRYEGSIAENIVQFNLKHLVVEETTRSIRPIDWVLFNPCGVHSYYAEPWFDGDTLRYVLIFCSTKPGAFANSGFPACRDITNHLADRLQRISTTA